MLVISPLSALPPEVSNHGYISYFPHPHTFLIHKSVKLLADSTQSCQSFNVTCIQDGIDHIIRKVQKQRVFLALPATFHG